MLRDYWRDIYQLWKVRDYIIGNIRYKLYYLYGGKLRFMIRKHIREQYELRIEVMDRECYRMGKCKICGCSCTALQFVSRSCDKPCYPRMLGKIDWNRQKKRLKS